MGFRFRKSIKIAPGLRLNVSKRGTSVSIGRRGATTNISKRGVRQTFGIPGTGISYSRKLGKGKQANEQTGSSHTELPSRGSNRGAGRKLGLGCGGIAVLVVLLAVCSNVAGGNRTGTMASPAAGASLGQAAPASAVLTATPDEPGSPSRASQAPAPVADEPTPSAIESPSSGPVAGAAQAVALSQSEIAGGGTQPVGSDCPPVSPVKGNVNRKGERIYHVPGDSSYSQTKPEECFASASDAAAAGYRAPLR